MLVEEEMVIEEVDVIRTIPVRESRLIGARKQLSSLALINFGVCVECPGKGEGEGGTEGAGVCLF